ncbi:hypothetical protein F4806DRAFT_456735 [Annulohypoxylon nitens]|nr:hypothetical protein F4806DRAFT_456735 [Annulohypoxylon nitens]
MRLYRTIKIPSLWYHQTRLMQLSIISILSIACGRRYCTIMPILYLRPRGTRPWWFFCVIIPPLIIVGLR